ncbi:TPA: hypothetical protein DEP96_00770 [Candidatus Uhrbacteria bacterium]|nr:hypothetical protein [Candidatus Uhrbacteria bacterium]
MLAKSPRGVSLLETVLYIGLLAIILPAMAVFFLQVQLQHVAFDARTRLEQTAALTFSELQNNLTSAQTITTSTSTLGVNPSILRFTNSAGATVVIDRPTVSTSFPSGSQNVRRLRLQTGTAPAVYLTDSDVDVATWQVSTIKNSANILTGLRFSVNFALLGATQSVYRKATFTSDTTISLAPQTIAN